MKKLPIGVSDFQEMIVNDLYYIDKTLLIKELLDSGSKVVMLPRPRRFGKTLGLSMLRYFFEKTESDTNRLFHGLAIWREGNAYTDKQGRYPVIFLTFKDVKSRTWSECRTKLYRAIGSEYERHRYLLKGEHLYSNEREEFARIIDLTADQSIFEDSLRKLSLYLERRYGHKTVILIDEYDTPIQEGYLHGYYEEVIGFMRSALGGALKDNVSLEKGVLTGILRVAKESVFSGLNNLEVCSLLNSKFSRHFGLLETEVERLLTDYGLNAAAQVQEAKRWYNGYIFGGTVIYNPWSIINYAGNGNAVPAPYWVNTSGNELIRQLITEGEAEIKEGLERLMRGESIRKEINDNIVFQEIRSRTNSLWSFLLMSGYLKPVSQQWDGRLYAELQIPNLEVAYLYEDIIRSWFVENIRDDAYQLMLKALTEGDGETFSEVLSDYVEKTFSMFDVGGEEPEKVYHAFVLGLLVSLQKTYEVKSNRESGYGRYDVSLIPRQPGRGGVIIEFKKTRRGRTLEEAADAALRQIAEKRYADELRERGVGDIFYFAVAFQGRHVLVKTAAVR